MDINDIDYSKLNLSSKLNLKFIQDGKQVRDELNEMTVNPMKYNTELLLKIIDDNKDTEYGRKYDFENIKSVEDYQNKVPITAYDDYAEYIFRLTEKSEKNLLTNYEVKHYAKSSGTMGNPKRIPVSSLNLDINSKYYYALRSYQLYEKLGLDWIESPFLNLIESFTSVLKSGDTYGSVSGLLISAFGDKLSEIVTSPIEALAPNVHTDTRYIHARFALTNPDIPYVVTSFVSIYLELLRYIKGNWEMLVEDIANGTIDESVRMPNETRESVLSKIEPMPQRAKELKEIFEEGFDEPFVKKIWPKLSVVAGIGTGGFSDYLEKIKTYTGPDVNFYLIGLTASEGLFSIPYELNNGDSILIPDSMFYEFLPLDAGEDYSKIVTLDKLEVGKDYEVITTNLSGFYRYRMKDVIRCVGMVNNMPKINFLYRRDQCLSLTGEKVNEENLREAAYKTEKELGFDLIDFSVYMDNDSSPMKYVFLMEVQDIPEGVTKEDINDKLNENFCNTDPVLGYKIEKGLIDKTDLYFLQPETYLLYKELKIAHGTSSAQVKPPRILRDDIIKKFFSVLLDDELN